MHKVFIVEDDSVIAGAVERGLRAWGLETRCAERFDNVLGEFAQFDPSLVLMDVTLPFFNGYHWCTEIRRVSKVPIVFVSSAADNMNVVMAMNMGADDFITKPFAMEVLIAKIQALLRRSYDFAAPSSLLECGGAVLSTADATVCFKGEKAELTKNEYKILQLLFENKGAIVPRDAIMTRLWESDSFVDENTLTVNVTRLRKKLETAGLQEFILTKKGMGYMICT